MYIRKEERSQINDFSFHIKKLETEEQIKPKAIKREGIINIKDKINQREKKKEQRKTNETSAF